MAQSKEHQLNQEDLKLWAFKFLRYVVLPTVIAFLGSYQLNFDIKIAWGVAAGTLINNLQYLFNLWKQGK